MLMFAQEDKRTRVDSEITNGEGEKEKESITLNEIFFSVLNRTLFALFIHSQLHKINLFSRSRTVGTEDFHNLHLLLLIIVSSSTTFPFTAFIAGWTEPGERSHAINGNIV